MIYSNIGVKLIKNLSSPDLFRKLLSARQPRNVKKTLNSPTPPSTPKNRKSRKPRPPKISPLKKLLGQPNLANTMTNCTTATITSRARTARKAERARVKVRAAKALTEKASSTKKNGKMRLLSIFAISTARSSRKSS